MSLVRAVHEALAAAGILHAVGGAVALAVHGAPRSTQDLDFLTVDPAALRPETWVHMPAETAIDIRRGDPDDPLRGVVRFQAAGEMQVDVVIARAAWLAPLLGRAKSQDVGGVQLPVVGPAELVLVKLDAGGPKDLWDVHQLLDARGDRLDLIEEVESLAKELPVSIRASWANVIAGRDRS
jgi:hypothetical protein